jgi:NADPH:quinone reductase-like Zn-dependent oxidoreductase
VFKVVNGESRLASLQFGLKRGSHLILFYVIIMHSVWVLVGTASTLRARTEENKASIVQEVIKNVWPEIESGKVKPVVENTFPLDKAVVGHRLMESNRHFGKILLLP